jgi:hypothetical protein
MQVGISDEERDALVALLREHIDSVRSPRISRLRPLKSVLSKLAPVRTRRMPPEQLTDRSHMALRASARRP